MSVEHGQVKIRIEDNIIIVHLAGSFNEFGALNYSASVKKSVQSLNNAPFFILVNLLDIHGGTPEAAQELENLNFWLNTQKLIAKATVVTALSTIELMAKLAPSRGKQLIKNFATDKEALEWLKSFN